jgi:Family of unknown function (DUF5706)
MSGESPRSETPESTHLKAPSEPLAPPAQNPEGALVASPSVQVPGLRETSGMDEAAKQEFLWRVHGYLNEYARFADSKAAYSGTLAAALLGVLYGTKAYVPLLVTSWRQWPPSGWMVVAAGILLLLCIASSIWVVLPSLGSTQTKGFIFWGSIAGHQTSDLLRVSFDSQSAHTLNEHLLGHVFDIATKVCIRKYRAVRWSIWLLVIGGIIAAAALILHDRP